MKNFNFKQFGIDHGEKVAVGFLGLFVVLILLSTRWATFQEKTPEGLIQNVDASKVRLAKGTWPQQERSNFYDETGDLKHDIRKDVSNMLSTLDFSSVDGT